MLFLEKMKMAIFFLFFLKNILCGTHNFIILRINEIIRFLNLPSYLGEYIVFGACLIVLLACSNK